MDLTDIQINLKLKSEELRISSGERVDKRPYFTKRPEQDEIF